VKHLRKYIFSVILIVALITVSIIGLTSVYAQTPTSTASPAPTTAPTPTATVAPPVTGQPINPDWEPPTPHKVTQDQPSTTVIADVKPGVVAINVSMISYDFFNQPNLQQGSGSGWIIDPSGIIVTNNHVVENASFISVTLNDGRVVNATAVATDPVSDLAVLKITADNLKEVSIGDSSTLVVGQTVIAIGNSLGLGISATEGIISALGVTINPGTQPIYDLIQTDAAINPGNSGGPLLNLSEEVVGINSIKIAEAGIEGMGYSISINQAMPIIQQLVQKGQVTRSFIGVSLQTVTPAIKAAFNLSVDKGAMIVGLVTTGPAAQAGLQLGDVIVSINDQEVATAVDATRLVRSTQVEQQLTIGYWRGNLQATATVTTVAGPLASPVPTASP
jgi:serine protease Do